ncbi:MAG: hypothetical protein IJ264_04960, partial [Clostridia bacterium]|nr:hypothetical protein [Clostridia bacterium]
EDEGYAHMLSACLSDEGISLGQLNVDKKTNEITVIPQLLDILKLRLKRRSLGSDKPYALTQQSRKGSTDASTFFLSIQGLQPTPAAHRLAPTADSLRAHMRSPPRQNLYI